MMLYECGIRYERTMENGMTKKVTELYLVDACSFAEAEGRITNEMKPYIHGDFDVVTIKRTNYSEIVENGADSANKWFKAKLMFVTFDEKSAKEKKQAVYFIVKAFDINNAHTVVVEHMKTSVVDYEIATLDETKIMDLFRYKVNITDYNG